MISYGKSSAPGHINDIPTNPWDGSSNGTGVGLALVRPLPLRLQALPLGLSTSIVRWPSRGISRSRETAVRTMAIGGTGVRGRDGTPTPIQDWPGCSHSNTDAVAVVGCSSNMTTGSRWIIAMGITEIRAPRTCKRCMDTATIRKRGNKGTTYRQVCVTSTRTLRSGVPGNGHAPFWNSGRRITPHTDCNGM